MALVGNDIDSNLRLDGGVAVVTGGARGIGQAIACSLARAGATIVVGDILDSAETLEQVHALGRDGASMHTDVADASAADDLIAFACKKYGRVDVLINNAGIDAPEGEVFGLDDAEWQRTVDVNLNGVFYCSRAALRRMVDQESGTIVNLSSQLAWMGAVDISPAYNASKAGVLGLTMSLATQVANSRVRVNAIVPGLIRSRDFGWSQEEEERRTREYALGLGKPEDVAEAVRFLVSPAARWITGTVLYMHGGYRRSSPWWS